MRAAFAIAVLKRVPGIMVPPVLLTGGGGGGGRGGVGELSHRLVRYSIASRYIRTLRISARAHTRLSNALERARLLMASRACVDDPPSPHASALRAENEARDFAQKQ